MTALKAALLITLALYFTACIGGSSGGGSSTTAAAPIADLPADPAAPPADEPDQAPDNNQPPPTMPPAAPPPAAPAFGLSDLTNASFSQASGTVSFSSTEVTDSRCGGRYTITSATEANGVVTIATEIVQASFVDPGNDDCRVHTDQSSYWFTANCSTRSNKPALDIAFKITYTIEAVSGGVAVTRALSSRQWREGCNPVFYSTDVGSMSEELYYE